MNRRRAPLVWFVLAFALIACGQAPSLSEKPAFLTANTNRVDFGEVEVGSRAELPVFLLNQGEMDLRIKGVEGDSVGGAFTMTVAESTIAPQNEVTAQVTFVPQGKQAYATVFVVANDSLNEPELHVTLMGIGVLVDPCEEVICDDPPPPACLGSGVSRVFDPAGTCDADGECDYETFTESCSFGCDQETGECKPDPCIGVLCNAPNNPCSYAIGTCSGGTCTYAPNNGIDCQDGDPCTVDDKCIEGSCRGQPKVCADPPAAECPDENTRHVWATQGVCNAEDGLCLYTEQTLTCSFGCLDGQCQGDPCYGIVCNSPPTSCHQQAGACDDGACTYGFADDIPCEDDDLCTTGGECLAGACNSSQVMCTTPPPNICNTTSQLRRYLGIGACRAVDGQCEYSSELVSCVNGCELGACRDEPQFGSDVLTVQIFYEPEHGIVFLDYRDVDLILANPLNQLCDYFHASPNWGNYGTCGWSGVGTSEETILHTVSGTDLADGTYRIETNLYNDCAERLCAFGVCYCDSHESVPYALELRINNVLAMSCTHSFPAGDVGETVEIATIGRDDGYLQTPVPSGSTGVNCTVY